MKKVPRGLPSKATDSEMKQALGDMYRQIFADADLVPQFFSEDFILVSDGRTMRFADFVAHVRHVVEMVDRIEFEIADVVQTGDRLADRHLVTVTRKGGQKSLLEVYLFGTLRDGRFIAVNETSRVVEGDHSSKALASALPQSQG